MLHNEADQYTVQHQHQPPVDTRAANEPSQRLASLRHEVSTIWLYPCPAVLVVRWLGWAPPKLFPAIFESRSVECSSSVTNQQSNDRTETSNWWPATSHSFVISCIRAANEPLAEFSQSRRSAFSWLKRPIKTLC